MAFPYFGYLLRFKILKLIMAICTKSTQPKKGSLRQCIESYIKRVLLKSKQVMHMDTRLLKAFPWGKMEISSHFIHFQESIDITTFTFFILDSLQESFSFALNAIKHITKLISKTQL